MHRPSSFIAANDDVDKEAFILQRELNALAAKLDGFTWAGLEAKYCRRAAKLIERLNNAEN